MIRLFKRKTERKRLEYKFKKLMQQWHTLASIHQSVSDQKFYEAQQLAKRLNSMKRNEAA